MDLLKMFSEYENEIHEKEVKLYMMTIEEESKERNENKKDIKKHKSVHRSSY